MRVFITGATGVIGRRLVPLAIDAGHTVSAVARTPAKRDTLVVAGAHPVDPDLFDPAAVRRAVADHDAVINLATHIPPLNRALLPGAWKENDRLRGTAAPLLASAAAEAGVERLIQESFAPIYEAAGDAWITEQSPVRAARYNRTSLEAERAANRFTGDGRTGIILRFAGFYGPDSEFAQQMIRWARRGWAPLPGEPHAYVSAVTHDDAATAVLAALSAPAGTYNVVDDEPLSRREFVDALGAALGVAPLRLPPAWITHLLGSLGELLARSQRISNRKLREATGWAPRFPSAREGWRAIVSGARDSGRAASGRLRDDAESQPRPGGNPSAAHTIQP